MPQIKGNATLVSSNEYVTNQAKFKMPKILEAKARGSTCFDFDFYIQHNADLGVLKTHEALWKHYIYFGQFEARPHHFTCAMDLSAIVDQS